ncbi:glutathione S-transferase family protein [Vibrio sp. SCSIO 43132]|uniref:glutathione S-transferase family protein n=1 Tax=Vibrio sp. SCSIO 43132 TaxID=2779363 RepID=UPI001CAA1833|nr:glutathione S-transferase family protein [Vibrio sp. SCSIO 43132]UAB73618.1 glutathione S-transferase family protein [Vibrio sp. SCSIO 43132]
MQTESLELISYKLCPYVQRSVITLLEKGIPFTRTDIDLSAKPDWFNALSPNGKVPLLRLDKEHIIFESAVICEFLNDSSGGTLLPNTPLARAKHRSWIEFASQTLNAIGQYYSAKDRATFNHARQQLRSRFETLEEVISGPYFSGTAFMLVDAAYAPVFRYFDVFEQRMSNDLFDGLEKVGQLREILATRSSVKEAVAKDFDSALIAFVMKKQSYLAGLLHSGDLEGT